MSEKLPQAKDYFTDSLRTAIANGDLVNLREAMDDQKPSFVTEGISNRLLVRDFLTLQKQRLSQFDEGLESGSDVGHDEYTRSYIAMLDRDLATAFIDEAGSQTPQKLKGDERLRREFRESGDAIAFATHIAAIDVRKLTPPEDIVGWMQNVRDSIVEDLWDCVQTYREQGFTQTTASEFHETVIHLVGGVDEMIRGSLSL